MLALHVGDGQLLSINVANGNEHFTSKYGVLYNHDKTTILQYPCGKRRKEYTIPASVTTVAGDCFSHARHLEHASLPEGLKAMGSSAFGFCRKLKSMWVPDGRCGTSPTTCLRVVPTFVVLSSIRKR